MNESAMDQSQGSPKMNASLGIPPFETPKNLQFPRLSELPVCSTSRMCPDNPIDRLSLEKTTPRPDQEEQVEKDIKPLITDTVERLVFSLNQSRHQIAVQQELKALLEHEKKILVQLAERATKFSSMKDENKKKIDDWEAEHKQRMSFYSKFLKDLMEFPEDHCLTQDGVPMTVAQKILYSIVEKTGNIANNAIVQLSMQNTLVNDIDLSLGKLRQFCAVMIKQIELWLKSLNTQSENQERIAGLWEAMRLKIKSLKEKKDEESGKNVPAGKLQTLEARVSKLENAVDNIQGADPVNPLGSSPAPVNPRSSPESPQQRPQHCPPCPPCPPEVYPTGREYFGNIYSPPSPRPQPPNIPTSQQPLVGGRTQRVRGPPGQSAIDVVDSPAMAYQIPVAALERGGRPRGQPIPRTPPTPPPPQYGRFNPQAASSPHGSIIREPQDYFSQPTHPQMGQPLDPALIPKIQDDLERLSRRNKKLEELVNNFRQMRALLTDEMDKAVKLNQKLQRDLYYVAQEAEKQPQ